MRKVLASIIIVITVACFSGCTSSDKAISPFGIYMFERVTYLSPLSSSLPEIVNQQMAETKYIIKKELFKIELKDHAIEVKKPIYKREEVSSQSDVDSRARWQYTVFDGNKESTHYRLYLSTDKVWIAQYADNTVDGSEIIMYIYQLERQ